MSQNVNQPVYMSVFVIFRRYGLNISDFGKSWRDGVAFNAIIDNISPGLVDMNQVRQQAPRVNLENAFSAAESHLGIPRLIDPEGRCDYRTAPS